MSDRKLLKKVRDGDKEALSDIIKQYYADIFRFCLYMIQNEEDSYDITQVNLNDIYSIWYVIAVIAVGVLAVSLTKGTLHYKVKQVV